jgi:hypothetical protein
MSNYNEALETEKRTLSLLVETSFYPSTANYSESLPQINDKEEIIEAILKNPMLAQQVMQLFQVHAVPA